VRITQATYSCGTEALESALLPVVWALGVVDCASENVFSRTSIVVIQLSRAEPFDPQSWDSTKPTLADRSFALFLPAEKHRQLPVEPGFTSNSSCPRHSIETPVRCVSEIAIGRRGAANCVPHTGIPAPTSEREVQEQRCQVPQKPPPLRAKDSSVHHPRTKSSTPSCVPG